MEGKRISIRAKNGILMNSPPHSSSCTNNNNCCSQGSRKHTARENGNQEPRRRYFTKTIKENVVGRRLIWWIIFISSTAATEGRNVRQEGWGRILLVGWPGGVWGSGSFYRVFRITVRVFLGKESLCPMVGLIFKYYSNQWDETSCGRM